MGWLLRREHIACAIGDEASVALGDFYFSAFHVGAGLHSTIINLTEMSMLGYLA